MKKKIEPTPEDYAKVREDVARGPDLLEILARREARERVDRERREQRRQFFRRLLPFRRAA